MAKFFKKPVCTVKRNPRSIYGNSTKTLVKLDEISQMEITMEEQYIVPNDSTQGNFNVDLDSFINQVKGRYAGKFIEDKLDKTLFKLKVKIDCLGINITGFDLTIIMYQLYSGLMNCTTNTQFCSCIVSAISALLNRPFSEIIKKFTSYIVAAYVRNFGTRDVMFTEDKFGTFADFLDKVKLLCGNFNGIVTSEFGEKFSNFLTSILALPFAEKFNLGEDWCGFSKLQMKIAKKNNERQHKVVWVVGLIENAQYILRRMADVCHHKGDWKRILVDDEEMQEYFKQFSLVTHYIDKLELVANQGWSYNDYLLKIQECIDLNNELSNQVADKDVRKRLKAEKLLLNKARYTVTDKLMILKQRETPDAIILVAPPGVGKSAITQQIIKLKRDIDIGLGRTSIPFDPSQVYYYNPLDDYMSEYSILMRCIVMDDIDQWKKEIMEQLKGGPAAQSVMWINEVPHVTNQAELHNKGQIPINVDLVIGTANTTEAGLQNVFIDQGGVRRRFLFVDIEVKEAYRKPGETQLAGDKKGTNFDMHWFYPRKYININGVNQKMYWNGDQWDSQHRKPLNFQEFALFYKKHLIDKYEQQDRARQAKNEFLTSSVCASCGITRIICPCNQQIHVIQSAYDEQIFPNDEDLGDAGFFDAESFFEYTASRVQLTREPEETDGQREYRQRVSWFFMGNYLNLLASLPIGRVEWFNHIWEAIHGLFCLCYISIFVVFFIFFRRIGWRGTARNIAVDIMSLNASAIDGTFVRLVPGYSRLRCFISSWVLRQYWDFDMHIPSATEYIRKQTHIRKLIGVELLLVYIGYVMFLKRMQGSTSNEEEIKELKKPPPDDEPRSKGFKEVEQTVFRDLKRKEAEENQKIRKNQLETLKKLRDRDREYTDVMGHDYLEHLVDLRTEVRREEDCDIVFQDMKTQGDDEHMAKEDAWKPTYVDITRLDGPPSTTTLLQLQNACEHNIMTIIFKGPNGDVHGHVNAFGLYGNICAIPRHTYDKIVNKLPYRIDLLRTTIAQKKGPNRFNIIIDEANFVDVGADDFMLFKHASIGTLRDLRRFLLEDYLEGKGKGNFLYRDTAGNMQVISHKGFRKTMVNYSSPDGVQKYNYLGYLSTTDIKTDVGMCGGPYLISTMNGTCIGGIHVAGGICSGLYATSICPVFGYQCTYSEGVPHSYNGLDLNATYVTDQSLEIKQEVHPKAPFRMLQQGDVGVYGTLNVPRPRFHSDVTATLMCNEVLEHYKLEDFTHFSPRNVNSRIATLNNLQPMVTKTDIPHMVVRHIVMHTTNLFERVIKRHDIKLDCSMQPRDVGINGNDDITYMNRLKVSTSGGFAHRGKKRKYMVEIEPTEHHATNYDVVDEISEELNIIDQRALSGQRVQVVWDSNFKDEPLSKKKILANKCRIFNAGPFAFSIYVRQLFLWAVVLFQGKYRYEFGMAIGINTAGQDWTELYEWLIRFGVDRCLAGDHAGYDKVMISNIVFGAFQVLINIARNHGASDDDIKRMYAVATEIAYPITNCFGLLLQLDGSNPSGNPLTIIINCIVNIMYMMMAAKKIEADRGISCIDYDNFYDHLRLVVVGDDNIATSRYLWLNHTTISQALAHYGLEYTMSDKESESRPFINISEADFLKRRFVPGVYREGIIMAPLAEESIIKSLSVCTKSRAILFEEQCAQIIYAACREYFQYGKEVFQEKRMFLDSLCYKYDLHAYLPDLQLPTFHQMYEDRFPTVPDMTTQDGISMPLLQSKYIMDIDDDVNSETMETYGFQQLPIRGANFEQMMAYVTGYEERVSFEDVQEEMAEEVATPPAYLFPGPEEHSELSSDDEGYDSEIMCYLDYAQGMEPDELMEYFDELVARGDITDDAEGTLRRRWRNWASIDINDHDDSDDDSIESTPPLPALEEFDINQVEWPELGQGPQ